MQETLASKLGVRIPLIQAPMAGSQDGTLAVAVREAGALGSLACATLSADTLRGELARVGPGVNLNFFCHTPRQADDASWRRRLEPYYRELGLDPEARVASPTRAPFSEEVAALLEPMRPRVLSFHFGLPAPALLARVKAWGALVLSSATTVDEARWLEANGADMIIAQGSEAGGHRGMFLTDDLTTQLGTFALVPRIVATVKLPVIAAGGIADAAGIRAALALGAQGVQVGSAYLSCPEATTSAVHRAALKHADHTAITNLFSGRPARGIVNRLMRELGPVSNEAPPFPLASAALAPLRAAAERSHDGSFSPLWAGQNARSHTLTAAELTRELSAAFSE
ncbi:MAG: nitronate monooxygenase [Polyangiales bacterium]